MRSLRARTKRWTIILFFTFVLFIVMGEFCLRFFFPQPMLYPRWKYSDRYGVELPTNTVMRHWRPGKWEFHYTINGDGMRGPITPVKGTGGQPNVLVLGDSYTMGMGVTDGEEYPAIIAEELDASHHILNAGCPGWGLTQEIRYYVEHRESYDPRIVILQFCANDPEDNLKNPVTRIVDGKFIFENASQRPNPIFRFFSGSWIMQHSQIYAIIRAVYEQRRDAQLAHADDGDAVASQTYTKLLLAFAGELAAQKTKLLVISVTGQLEAYPEIQNTIMQLDKQGQLRYVEVAPWLTGEKSAPSPEGHIWGAAAHRAIGEGLASEIRAQN
jgi:hypothetical protein